MRRPSCSPVRWLDSSPLALAALLALAAPPVSAQAKLFTVEQHTVQWISGSSQFGIASSTLGDTNLDGVPDFVVGAPRTDHYEYPSVGRYYVYSGKTLSLVAMAQGTGVNYDLGSAVAAVGDIDGDGISEFVAGASIFVHLVSGKGTPVAQVQYPFGSSVSKAVAGIGDANGDSIPDFAVANYGNASNGRVIAYSGATLMPLYTILGEIPNDGFAWDMAAVDDLTGDGARELWIGAIGGYPPTAPGTVRLVDGATGATIRTIQGWAVGDQFGLHVANAGDFDGDGVGDLAASGSGPPNRLRVYSGATGVLLHESVQPNGVLEIAGIGDVHGDGFDDLAIGQYVNALADRVAIVSGGSGLSTLLVQGPPSFGRGLGAAGDLDRDGWGDLLIGLPQLERLDAYSLVPKGISAYGAGTPGCAGAHFLTANSVPSPGNALFAITGGAAPPSSLGLALVADADLLPGGDPFGLGITLLVDLLQATEVLALDIASQPNGGASAPAPIPASPALSGKSYFAQALWAWPASGCQPSPFFLSTSNGVRIAIP